MEDVNKEEKKAEETKSEAAKAGTAKSGAEKHVREYVAFISYRHTELDKKVAKKIHTMVERYVIPKELRKNGVKKLGKVFRDEEELPVSSNLTESIETALDHSKFLIVICTPNLIQSIWCEREIAYFINKHGRDHVVGILVDGTPDQSFPKLLTQSIEKDADGNESIREVEPLAANLTDVNHHYKASRLRKEAVRLYAALLGCPFDSLWQREKRQKMRKLVAVMALGMTIAFAFCVSIYRKNLEILERHQQIEEQNVQIQSQNQEIQSQNVEIKVQYEEIQDKNSDLKRSEAEALIRSGELLYEKGDTRGAIANARLAVSTKEGRESVGAEAEFLLYRALGAGQDENCLRTVGVIEQDDEVHCMALSKDGSRIYTLGSRGYVRCFSTQDSQQLWFGDSLARGYYFDATARHRLHVLEEQGLLLCCMEECVTALNLEDGSLVWSHKAGNNDLLDFACLSNDKKTLAVIDNDGELLDSFYTVRLLDVATGEALKEIPMPEMFDDQTLATNGVVAYGDQVGAFSEDGRYMAGMIYSGEYTSYSRKGYVLLVDFEEETVKVLSTEDYEGHPAYPFVIGMICHADTQTVLALHYRPDEGGVSMEQISFKGKIVEKSLVPMSLPERGMTSPYATTFVVGQNNAIMASCLSMNMLYRLDNGVLANYSQSSAESVLKRSWIHQDSYARSDLAADGNHYAWYGSYGYSLYPVSEKKHIVFLEITDDYATSEGGYGYVMDENLVQVIVCDDNLRKLYVQKRARDPEVKAPDWTKELVDAHVKDMCLLKVNEDTLVVLQDLGVSQAAARLYFIDVATDTVKKTIDVNYEDFGSYASIHLLEDAIFWEDEKHFTFDLGLKLYVYDMETKQCSVLVEEAASHRIDQKYCKLSDGEILHAYLTYKKDAVYGDAGGRVMWQIGDGEIQEALAEEGEEWGGPYLTFGMEYFNVGENGYILVGSCEGENTRRNKLIAIDAKSGTKYVIVDQCKEETQGTVTVGKKKPVFAVWDADGVIRIYDIATQAVTQEISILEGQVVSDFTFAMEDDVIAIYTKDGWLFVYDVATGKELASREMGKASTNSVKKELTSYDDLERNRLLFTATGENGLVLDVASWKQTMILYDEVDTFFPKENKTYKLNRDPSLYEKSTETILCHKLLTLDELINKIY